MKWRKLLRVDGSIDILRAWHANNAVRESYRR